MNHCFTAANFIIPFMPHPQYQLLAWGNQARVNFSTLNQQLLEWYRIHQEKSPVLPIYNQSVSLNTKRTISKLSDTEINNIEILKKKIKAPGSDEGLKNGPTEVEPFNHTKKMKIPFKLDYQVKRCPD